MGWYIRKSFKFGPFRLNLSNSGVSTSFGVKGARINVSKRGTYVNLGTNGIYYRQKISGRTSSNSNANSSNHQNNDFERVSDVEELTDTTSRSFIDELQKIRNRKPLTMWLGLIPSFGIMIALLLFLERPITTNNVYIAQLTITKNFVHVRDTPSIHGAILQSVNHGDTFKFVERTSGWLKIQMADSSFGYVKDDLAFVQPKLNSVQTIKRFDEFPWLRKGLVIATVLLLIVHCSWIYRFDKKRRTLQIHYQMDEKLQKLHDRFIECFKEFAASNKIWTTLHTEKVSDKKYNSGASQLVSRVEVVAISADQKPVQFLKTNVQIPYIRLANLSLFFFPERLVLERQGHFAAVQYRNINVSINNNVRFIETEPVAPDASVVDYTWRYLNKNGEPDLRFVNNQKLPICLYSEYGLRSSEGLNEVITTSKPGAMNTFASFINTIGTYQEKIDAKS